MKDIIKFVVVFGFVYILWRLFWHSVFIAWDLFGLVGLAMLFGFVWVVGKKFLGTPGTQSAAGKLVTTALPSTDDRVSGRSECTSASNTFSLPLTDDYVTLVGMVQGLESRCARVWQKSAEDRRNYRKLRHESGAAARRLLEIEQETAVPDEALVKDIDDFMDGLCAIYLGASSQLQLEIRALLESNVRLLGNVYNYSGRAAAELRQTGKPLFLLRGLIAAAIDNNSSHRDWQWILGNLRSAALNRGIDPAPYFKFVAGLSSTEPDGIRVALEEFR